MRNWQRVFQNDLHPYCKRMGVPVAPCYLQHLVLSFFFSYSIGCEMIFLCGFSLHLPGD